MRMERIFLVFWVDEVDAKHKQWWSFSQEDETAIAADMVIKLRNGKGIAQNFCASF